MAISKPVVFKSLCLQYLPLIFKVYVIGYIILTDFSCICLDIYCICIVNACILESGFNEWNSCSHPGEHFMHG